MLYLFKGESQCPFRRNPPRGGEKIALAPNVDAFWPGNFARLAMRGYIYGMNTVAIKPELLKWARERSSLSLQELEGSFPKYAHWESGCGEPTLKQLEALAKRTSTPFGYFFLLVPPEDKLSIQDFRTARGGRPRRPSPNLLETVQTMEQRQGWMRDYLLEQGVDKLAFVGACTVASDPKAVAGDIRAELGKTRGWAGRHSTWEDAFRALRDAADEAGVMVFINGVVGNNTHRPLDVEEFRGFALVDDYAPLVFVNGHDAKGAQLFTLAHELAHVWLGQGGVSNLEGLQPADNQVERFCDQVAAEFLVPEVELKDVWPEFKGEDNPFPGLARRFKVSQIVAARRALDLGLIARAEFFSFYNGYLEEVRSRNQDGKAGGDFYSTQNNRLSQHFAGAVVRSAQEGALLYREAYQLTNLYGSTFDKFAKGLEACLA